LSRIHISPVKQSVSTPLVGSRFQVPVSPLPGTKVPGFPRSTQRIKNNQNILIKDQIKGTIYILSISYISTFFPHTQFITYLSKPVYLYPSIYLSNENPVLPSSWASTSPPVLFVDLPGWTPLPLIQRYQWAGNPVVTQSHSLRWQFGEVFGQGFRCGKTFPEIHKPLH